MNRSLFDKVAISCLYGNKIQQFFHRAVFDLCKKFFLISISLKSTIDSCTFIGGNNVPHLGFAVVVFVFLRVFVVRVNLNRKIFCRIDIFNQHGKFATV